MNIGLNICYLFVIKNRSLAVVSHHQPLDGTVGVFISNAEEETPLNLIRNNMYDFDRSPLELYYIFLFYIETLFSLFLFFPSSDYCGTGSCRTESQRDESAVI